MNSNFGVGATSSIKQDYNILPSDLARLVLGYLLDVGCSKSYRMFLSESGDLTEYRSLHSKGCIYPTQVNGYSLREIVVGSRLLSSLNSLSNVKLNSVKNHSPVKDNKSDYVLVKHENKSDSRIEISHIQTLDKTITSNELDVTSSTVFDSTSTTMDDTTSCEEWVNKSCESFAVKLSSFNLLSSACLFNSPRKRFLRIPKIRKPRKRVPKHFKLPYPVIPLPALVASINDAIYINSLVEGLFAACQQFADQINSKKPDWKAVVQHLLQSPEQVKPVSRNYACESCGQGFVSRRRQRLHMTTYYPCKQYLTDQKHKLKHSGLGAVT